MTDDKLELSRRMVKAEEDVRRLTLALDLAIGQIRLMSTHQGDIRDQVRYLDRKVDDVAERICDVEEVTFTVGSEQSAESGDPDDGSASATRSLRLATGRP